MFKKAILNPRSLGRQLILFGKLQVMLVLSLFWGVLFISFVKVWLDLPIVNNFKLEEEMCT